MNPSKNFQPLGQQEKAAIEHEKGVAAIIAGPGSGKTTVLTKRIIHLQKTGISHILALTFSHNAAEEIRCRIEKQNNAQDVTITTFHGFGLSMLKQYAHKFGRSESFSIIDQDEKETIFTNEPAINPRETNTDATSHTSVNFKIPGHHIKEIESYKQGLSPEIPTILDAYDKVLREKNAFDLDDLVYLPVQLLKNDKTIREKHQDQFPFILIDEYQDINHIQYELINLLIKGENPNLFIIGDPDQTIYGFRGSFVGAFDKIIKTYPTAKIIKLSKSYRCPHPVLRLGTQVLQKVGDIIGKEHNLKIHTTSCETDKSEADVIAAQIEKMIGGVRSFSLNSGTSNGSAASDITSFSDFAILCRTTSLFSPLINALSKRGIAHQVIGHKPFYLDEPFIHILRAMKQICSSNIFQTNKLGAAISNMIAEQKTVKEILETAVSMETISETDKKRFIRLGNGFEHNYNSFIHSLILRQSSDDFDHKIQAVSIMTLHASKGMEFNAVFIPGCEKGIIPFDRFGKKTYDEMQEEERLFYVGVTRTKQYLFLSHAGKRLIQGKITIQKKSHFLERIEKQLLDEKIRKSTKKNFQMELKF